MRKLNLLVLLFAFTFLTTALMYAGETPKVEQKPIVKTEKEEPFLWDLIFSNTKSVVPMVSTSTEIALSPYEKGFKPYTQMFSNQVRYKGGDRLLIQNHLWNEGDKAGNVDYYVILFDIMRPEYVWFWDGSFSWGPSVAHQFISMSVGFDKIDTIFDARLPNNPPVGKYIFAAGLAEPGTTTFYSISSIVIEII